MGYESTFSMTVACGVAVPLNKRFVPTMRNATIKAGMPVAASYDSWWMWAAMKPHLATVPKYWADQATSDLSLWPRFDDLIDHALGTADHDLTFVWELGGTEANDDQGDADVLVLALKGTTHTTGKCWNATTCAAGRPYMERDNVGPAACALDACTADAVKAACTSTGARLQPDVDPEALVALAKTADTLDLARASADVKTVLAFLGLNAQAAATECVPSWHLVVRGVGG
jgi:hypothetical protein